MRQFLEPGTRTTLIGKTGSGKSTLGAYMLRQSSQRWLIIDPKNDDKVASLHPYYLREMSLEELGDAWESHQYVSLVPPYGTDPQAVDDFVGEVFNTYQNFGIAFDELYFLHSGGRAGPGLMAVLTRGRSDKITYLGCTQRPAWVSLFCLSEAEYLAQMSLNLKADRKRVHDVTGKDAMLDNPPMQYGVWYYEQSPDTVTLIRPPKS